MKKKEELYSFPKQEHSDVLETDIKIVPIAELQDFEGHPFKVENDMALFELMQSIEKEGVIVPALARPKAGGGYELIAGHRRKEACKWAGINVMPVVIRDLDDNQAVIAMVDSNLQREHLKPSEKAFAYKMKLEAMKRQGARTDLTSSQVGTATSVQDGPKLENPTMKIYPLQSGHDEVGNWIIQQDETTEFAELKDAEGEKRVQATEMIGVSGDAMDEIRDVVVSEDVDSEIIEMEEAVSEKVVDISEVIDYTKLSIKERAALLPVPTDDYEAEYDAYCQRMGYTAEKMKSIRYKMTVYDEFLEEYNYRKKHYGVRDDLRMMTISDKSRGAR